MPPRGGVAGTVAVRVLPADRVRAPVQGVSAPPRGYAWRAGTVFDPGPQPVGAEVHWAGDRPQATYRARTPPVARRTIQNRRRRRKACPTGLRSSGARQSGWRRPDRTRPNWPRHGATAPGPGPRFGKPLWVIAVAPPAGPTPEPDRAAGAKEVWQCIPHGVWNAVGRSRGEDGEFCVTDDKKNILSVKYVFSLLQICFSFLLRVYLTLSESNPILRLWYDCRVGDSSWSSCQPAPCRLRPNAVLPDP